MRIGAGATDFGELGARMNVFEGSAPHAVYVPAGSDWSATAATDGTLAAPRPAGRGAPQR